jgi:hypothetical protein
VGACKNVLAMNLPGRWDLDASSCVNQEIKVFNRKLYKHMRVFDCASMLEMSFERDHYTRLGIHLNSKGKDHSAQLISTTIKNIFKISKAAPISMNWKETQKGSLLEKQRKANVEKAEVKEASSANRNRGNNDMNMANAVDCVSGVLNKKILQSEHIDSKGTRPTTRSIKAPISRNKDFLWEMLNNIHTHCKSKIARRNVRSKARTISK